MSLEKPEKRFGFKESVTRRGALAFMANVAAAGAVSAAGLSAAEARPVKRFETPERAVEEIIGRLAADFAPGGAEAAAWERGEDGFEGAISPERLVRCLDRLSVVAAELNRAYASRKGSSPLEAHLVRGQVPALRAYGLSKEQLDAVMARARPGAKPPAIAFNSFCVRSQGALYEVTVRHALAAGQSRFFSRGDGSDVAVAALSGGGSEALDFGDEGDASLCGRVGIVTGLDVEGDPARFHTPFIRATLPALRAMFPDFDRHARTDPNLAVCADSFFCLLPPNWAHLNQYNALSIRSMSGSFAGASDARGRLVPLGPLMSSVELPSGMYTGTPGRSWHVAFVATRKAVRDTIRARNAYANQR